MFGGSWEIILFAAVAAFFVFKLRSVLGKRDGHEEKPRFDPFGKRPEEDSDDKVIPLPNRDKARRRAEAVTEDDLFDDGDEESAAAGAENAADSALAAGLAQIRRADSAFEPGSFVAGARGAFEMIVAAFAEGDTKVLRPLLANEVYENFSGAIEEREKRNETLETTLIGITGSEIIEAELDQKTAFVTVSFVSEQVNVTRDAEGEVVDGDPSHVAKINDIWTFARNTRSRDPNWSLVATRSSN